MAVIKLYLGAVNITNYMIIRARKVSDPTTIAAQEVYTPTQVNAGVVAVVPSTGDIDAANYYVDFYESTDGVALTTLHKTVEFDAKLQVPISETRFYKAGGVRSIDPAADQPDLVDPYLNGKNITSVYKEGFRPLVPPGGDTDSFKDYSLITGGGIHLENGQTFNFGEVLVVVITFVSTFDQTTSNAGLYDGVTLITATMTLTSAHRNQRLKCEATASHLVITLEDIATVPAGKFYYFNSNGGNQKKARILAQSGQSILYQGNSLPELSIGKGEHVRIEKYGTAWEVVDAHAGIAQVGEVLVKGLNTVLNALPGDGSVISGDDEPRLFAYVNGLPSSHKVVDSSVSTQPTGKEGQFVIDVAGRRLRLPNFQGYALKALNSFSTFGSDASRPYDYPGGSQPENVGDHKHFVLADEDTSSSGFPTSPSNATSITRRYAKSGGGAESYFLAGSATTPSTGLTSNPTVHHENTVKNIGQIILIRT